MIYVLSTSAGFAKTEGIETSCLGTACTLQPAALYGRPPQCTLALTQLSCACPREAREAAEREHEREREAARERARLLRADMEDPDSDEDEPRWRRKPLATRHAALSHLAGKAYINCGLFSGIVRSCCVKVLERILVLMSSAAAAAAGVLWSVLS